MPDYTKHSLLLSPCPNCNQVPVFHSKRLRVAHGEFPLFGWVECPRCFIRTSEFIIDGSYGVKSTADTPVAIWNLHIAL